MMNSNSGGFFNNIPPVTKNLIIINVLFWIASLALPKIGIDLVKLLGLHFFYAPDFKAYQLVSYMFMHDTRSFTHVFFNMFAVYMFGRIIESTWGPKRFLIFYFVTGIGAGLIQELTWFYSLRDVIALSSQIPINIGGGTLLNQPEFYNLFITVGASGAVFGILLAFAMLYPNIPLYIIFIPIPIKAKYFVVFYGLIELFLGVSNFGGDNVAHFAHLGGMIFGYILVKYWKKIDRENGRYFY